MKPSGRRLSRPFYSPALPSLLSVMPVPQEKTKVVSARSLPVARSGPAPERDLHPLPPQNQAGSALHPGRIEAHILDAEWEVRRAAEIPTSTLETSSSRLLMLSVFA